MVKGVICVCNEYYVEPYLMRADVISEDQHSPTGLMLLEKRT